MFTSAQNPNTKALARIARAIKATGGHKSQLAVLGYACVEAKGGLLTIRATDMGSFLTMTVKGEGDLTPRLISITHLCELLKGATSFRLEDENPNQYPVTLKDYPGFLEVAEELTGERTTLTLPLDKATLAYAFHAVCREETRRGLCVLRVEADAVKNEVSLVATDGMRMAVGTCCAEVSGPGFEASLPHEGISVLLALLGDQEEAVRVTQAGARTLLEGSDWSLILTVETARFPAWRRIIPEAYAVSIRMATKDLLDATKAVGENCDKVHHHARFYFEAGWCQMHFCHPDHPKTPVAAGLRYETLSFEGTSLLTGLAVPYLTQIAEKSPSGRIVMRVPGAGDAYIFDGVANPPVAGLGRPLVLECEGLAPWTLMTYTSGVCFADDRGDKRVRKLHEEALAGGLPAAKATTAKGDGRPKPTTGVKEAIIVKETVEQSVDASSSCHDAEETSVDAAPEAVVEGTVDLVIDLGEKVPEPIRPLVFRYAVEEEDEGLASILVLHESNKAVRPKRRVAHSRANEPVAV